MVFFVQTCSPKFLRVATIAQQGALSNVLDFTRHQRQASVNPNIYSPTTLIEDRCSVDWPANCSRLSARRNFGGSNEHVYDCTDGRVENALYDSPACRLERPLDRGRALEWKGSVNILRFCCRIVCDIGRCAPF
jgi:hypothetical protein